MAEGEWSYSTKLAISGTQRLGYIDATISELYKDDPKYAECRVEARMR